MFFKPYFLSSDTPTAMASSRMGQMEETSLKAIQQAKRRRMTSWFAIGAAGALVLVAVVVSNNQRNRSKRLANEFLTIEQARTAETNVFQELMKQPDANPDKAPDYSQSTAKFIEFAKRNPTTPLGIQAALQASTDLLTSKQPDKAQELLESLTTQTAGNNILQARIRKTLAGVYADSKSYDKSLKEIDIIEKIPNLPAPTDVKLMRGKFVYLSGNKAEAAKILKELANSGNSELGANTTATEASLWLGYWGL